MSEFDGSFSKPLGMKNSKLTGCSILNAWDISSISSVNNGYGPDYSITETNSAEIILPYLEVLPSLEITSGPDKDLDLYEEFYCDCIFAFN